MLYQIPAAAIVIAVIVVIDHLMTTPSLLLHHSPPHGRGRLGQDAKPRQKLPHGIPLRKAGPTDPHGLEDPPAPQLVDHRVPIKDVRLERVVGLDAPDVVRMRDIDALAESVELGGELGAHGDAGNGRLLLRGDAPSGITIRRLTVRCRRSSL